MTMHAAVVRSFDHPPRYESYDTPEPGGPDEAVVEVLAAGLHPRVRTDASGRHYTSTGTLPMVPGTDGVGRLPDGRRVYFVAPRDAWGSMAERALVDLRRVVALPESADPLAVAAAMNPAGSSWLALRRRVPLQPGQAVLVLGATGSAGTMAVQVAKHLGAGRVVGAGRNPGRLAELPGVGADEVVALTDDPEATSRQLAAAAAEVDIVVDYLWGEPATAAMAALLRARADRSRALDWIQIGAVAGPTIELPSVALRSANLRIQGNGQGAVATEAYLAELPALVEEIGAGTIAVKARPVALADVEATWGSPEVAGERTVFVPQPRVPHSAEMFDDSYSGSTPPWDIGRPQPAFARLAQAGGLTGRVLDVGCGTGEHVLLAASHGHEALGVDIAPRAIALAKEKAAARSLAARLLVFDALRLPELGMQFDTVLDCGLFHCFDDRDRRPFVDGLAHVVRPGGRYHMLCFSDRQPGDWGPRRITEGEIRASFAEGWIVDSIEPTVLDITIDPAGALAWQVTLTRR